MMHKTEDRAFNSLYELIEEGSNNETMIQHESDGFRFNRKNKTENRAIESFDKKQYAKTGFMVEHKLETEGS